MANDSPLLGYEPMVCMEPDCGALSFSIFVRLKS